MLVALAHVTRIDTVFGQRLRAIRVIGQKPVAVVVEVTHQRHINAHAVQLLADIGNRLRRLRGVDGDAYHLRAGVGEFLDLDGRADRVHRVRIGHGLDAHRRTTPDCYHPITPHHAGLQRCPHQRRGERGCTVSHCQIFVHYFTSKRATLPWEIDLISYAFPRTQTSVTSAFPTTTASGG